MVITKYKRAQYIVLLFCILLCTFLRELIIPLYIILPFLFYLIMPYRVGVNPILLITYCIINTVILSFFALLHIENIFLSIYIVLILLVLLLSSPVYEYCKGKRKKLFFVFIKFASYLMLVNNVLGIIQYVIYPVFPVSTIRDDSFIGIYGRHGIGVHGMALINGLLFLFYYSKYKYDKQMNSLLMLLFFLISFVFGFYGMSLIIMIMVFVLYYLVVRKKILLTIGIFVATTLIVFAIYLVSPRTFRYNYANVERFVTGIENIDTNQLNKSKKTKVEIPRKLYAFYYYYIYYIREPQRFLLGTGPGTFNSRTSFLLNGDYSPQNPFEKVLGVHEPLIAKEKIYPLWERKLVLKKYRDGTRNEPFSSVVALLAEYGFIFSLLLFVLLYKKIKIIMQRLNVAKKKNIAQAVYIREFFVFAFLFMLGNLVLDNILEFTEFLFYVFIFKFIEIYSIWASDNKNENILYSSGQ